MNSIRSLRQRATVNPVLRSGSCTLKPQLGLARRYATAAKADLYDVVVVGGGPAGLSLASSLRSSSVTNGLRVALVEGFDLASGRNWIPESGNFSNRVSSLTPGSVGFLTNIGAWKHVQHHRVQAYHGMQVWDGVSGSRIEFNWDRSASETIAYMTENTNLVHGLLSRLSELGGVEVIDKSRVENISFGEDNGKLDLRTWPTVEITGGKKLTARLLVGADGANSPVRTFAGIESRGWDYERHGVVATVKLVEGSSFEAEKTAYQRFLPTGPVALLPLPGDFATLVWSTTPQIAAKLKNLESGDMAAMINAAFRLSHVDIDYIKDLEKGISGEVQWRESVSQFDSARVPARIVGVQEKSVASFPLKMRHADSYIAERVALIGDAAHTVHPLAGQGLNQGIGDVQSLIKTIETAVQHGQDIGSVLSLEPYCSDQYFKNNLMLGVVDKLHKLYGTTYSPVVALRSFGLSAVDSMTGLKSLIMKQAAGVPHYHNSSSMTDAKLQQAPFVKQLAANDRPTRDKAVASLRSYLASQKTFSQIELLKLWKGLFYCMWMSDRPRTQQRLAADLADLLTPMEEKNFVPFLEAFWITMVCEWNGVDVLRMDKFLLLVRMYLASSFRYMRGRNWDERLVEKVVKVMKEVPLNTTDKKVPNGLCFHLTDIYVDELEKLIPEDMKDHPLPVEKLVEPFQELIVKSPTKMVRIKSKELLLDDRLAQWGFDKASEGETKEKAVRPEPESEGGEDVGMGEDEEWGGIDD